MVKTKHQAYTDSLKQVDYTYTFPILGQGAYRKGFDIPYPAGLMANYMWMKQNLLFDNMQLGLKTDELDIQLTDVDFIEFGENTNTSYAYNVRPDLWILPFLNVYGIFGGGQSRTEVNLTAPFPLYSNVEQSLRTAGVGIMGAGGIGPIWFSVDANWTWSKPELLDKPVRVNVMGIRFGHTFKFKNKPERNIALWVGAMSMKMNSDTKGEILLIDAIPAETWERRDELVTNYYDWYNNEATPVQKILDMATIDGATCLNMENKIGSIGVGKQADIITIDISKAKMQPVNNIISNIVYSANGNDVVDSIVAGRVLMQDRQIL